MFRLLKTLLILAVFTPFASQAELFKGTAIFAKGTSRAPITLLVYSGRIRGTIHSADFGRITLRGMVGNRGAFRGKVTGSNGAKGLFTGRYSTGFLRGVATVTIAGQGVMIFGFSGSHALKPLTSLAGPYELDGSGPELTRATLTLTSVGVDSSHEDYSYILRLYKNQKRVTEMFGFLGARTGEAAPFIRTTDFGFTDYQIQFQFSRPAGIHAPRLDLTITDKKDKLVGEFSGRRAAE